MFETIVGNFKNPVSKKRIDYLLRWYNRKAIQYKILTYLGTVTSILLPATITLLNSGIWGDASVFVTCISIFASVSAGMHAFFCSKDNWLRYRSTIEELKREIILFSTKTEDLREPEYEFMQRVESIVNSEFSQWYRIRSEKNVSEGKQAQENTNLGNKSVEKSTWN